MISHRTVLARTLVPAYAPLFLLALVLVLALAQPASAGRAAGAGPLPPAQPTPQPSGASAYEPGDLPRLPALFPARQAAPVPEMAPPSIHTTENILVLGMDARPGGKMWRTDTVMIAAIDAPNRQVGILSIPRAIFGSTFQATAQGGSISSTLSARGAAALAAALR